MFVLVSCVVPLAAMPSLGLAKPDGLEPTYPVTGARTRAPVADVVSVAVRGEPGAYVFEVGVASPDTGCEQYADWWEIVGDDGTLIGRRVLRHSHVDEQPFVRSGSPIDVAEERVVWIRAHMHPFGYGGTAMRGSIRDGFEPVEPPEGFALDVAEVPPLPDGCAF